MMLKDAADPDAVILGGGAAGLMCALHAGRRGRRIVVIEHVERVGKKILMSGGGRCNFTNLGTSPAQFLSSNPHYCKSALARYTPSDFVSMIERHGIAYHEKELGQLFCDLSSKQIVRMLLDECADARVSIETGTAITSVDRVEAGFRIHTSRGRLDTPVLVVATGGLSIPRMGATGFGFELAHRFGHHVVPTRAGLVPLTLSGKHLQRLDGLAGVATDVEASCNGGGFRNRMLITHRGLSGPAILQISSYWQPGDTLRLDLLPGYDALAWLAERRSERPGAELRNVLAERIPKRLAQRLCEVWIDSRPLREYSPTQLREVAAVLQHWPIAASGSEGYRTAEVTLGGVDTNELNSTTMASRLIPGLYFIGEVVDVTGWLGGYNFQWAWASGHAAGVAL